MDQNYAEHLGLEIRMIGEGYFMKHRREQEEVFLTDQRDFEIGIAAFFELESRVQTTETAAEDEDASFFIDV
jgi:hypothetical protein